MEKVLKNKDILLLLLLLVCGGVLSSCLKYEVLWDFANYHYYNPWAFFNNRVNYDVAVAGFNAFFNPLPDVPLYWLIKYFNDFPLFIYFVQGMWFGALAFVYLKIIVLFFDTDTLKGKIFSLFAFFVGLTSWACFMQIGTSTNEISLAFGVFGALYILLKQFCLSQSSWGFIISGFLLGSVCGLKLTNVTYCIASGISLLLLYRNLQKPLLYILLFSLFGIIGFLLTNGFWMIEMWEHFQNPLFPFANEIFKSDFMENLNLYDHTYVPRTLLQKLYFPFDFEHSEGGTFIADFRLAIIYIILIFYLLYWLMKKMKGINIFSQADPKMRFIIVWLITAYVFWMSVFSIYRYAVPIFLLISLLIVKAIEKLFPQKTFGQILYFSMLNILFFQFIMTPYFSLPWGYRNISVKQGQNTFEKFVYIENVNIPENTLLLMYENRTSAVLPYWGQNKNIRGVKVAQNFYVVKTNYGVMDFFEYNEKWKNYKEQVIKEHKGPKLALVTSLSPIFLRDKYLENMLCRKLQNNIADWVLCVPPELENIVWNAARDE